MKKFIKESVSGLECMSNNITRWIGSISSIVIHTILFVGAFVLYFWGIDLDKILLVVTTVVSLEAIYLAIFIQMSVNKQSYSLGEVASNIDEIQEDVEEIEKDIDEIQEDIEEDVEEEEGEEIRLERIGITLENLIGEIAELKKQHKNAQNKKETSVE